MFQIPFMVTMFYERHLLFLPILYSQRKVFFFFKLYTQTGTYGT